MPMGIGFDRQVLCNAPPAFKNVEHLVAFQHALTLMIKISLNKTIEWPHSSFFFPVFVLVRYPFSGNE
jgi:hypothetical protein